MVKDMREVIRFRITVYMFFVFFIVTIYILKDRGDEGGIDVY